MNERPVGPGLARYRTEPGVGDREILGQRGQHGKLRRAVSLHDLFGCCGLRIFIVHHKALHRPGRARARTLRPVELEGHVVEGFLGVRVGHSEIGRALDHGNLDGRLVRVEERLVGGIPEAGIQPVINSRGARRQEEARLRPMWVRIDPTAQVVERTILQHHDNDVLDLRKDRGHERISWRCMERTRTGIESLLASWPAHDQAVPLSCSFSGSVARAISTCKANQANDAAPTARAQSSRSYLSSVS